MADVMFPLDFRIGWQKAGQVSERCLPSLTCRLAWNLRRRWCRSRDE